MRAVYRGASHARIHARAARRRPARVRPMVLDKGALLLAAAQSALGAYAPAMSSVGATIGGHLEVPTPSICA